MHHAHEARQAAARRGTANDAPAEVLADPCDQFAVGMLADKDVRPPSRPGETRPIRSTPRADRGTRPASKRLRLI